MTKRQKQYQDMLSAARDQSTGWLQRCHDESGQWQNGASRLAVRTALRERTVSYVEVDRETAYGSTVRMSRSVRVF